MSPMAPTSISNGKQPTPRRTTNNSPIAIALCYLLMAANAAGVAARGLPSPSNNTHAPGGDTGGRLRRRHANLCSSSVPGRVSCHAKILLQEIIQTTVNVSTSGVAEEASNITVEEAFKLAYEPDLMDTISGAASSGLRHRDLLQGMGNGYFKPQNLQQVYMGSKSATRCQAIGIVDAYANPSAQSDLNLYRSNFGLPALTIQQYDQNGNTLQTSQSGSAGYVSYDNGWAGEQMLDLAMASAMCPCCPLIYIGAKSASSTDLNAAVKTAVAKGASVVSMSWGSTEAQYTAQTDASTFNFPGASSVVFTSSTGDNGYAGGVIYPASSAYVVAVGGTSLKLDSNSNRISETTWNLAGSGCSRYTSKPSWQKDTGCAGRTVADVAAVADPNTGVYVYLLGKLMIFGGTSASAPIIAGMYASGYFGSVGSPAGPSLAQSFYQGGQNSNLLIDITSGPSTSSSCSSYLCTAVAGYDGPTGNGSPLGSSSGTPSPPPSPSRSPTSSPSRSPTPSPSPSPSRSPTQSPSPSPLRSPFPSPSGGSSTCTDGSICPSQSVCSYYQGSGGPVCCPTSNPVWCGGNYCYPSGYQCPGSGGSAGSTTCMSGGTCKSPTVCAHYGSSDVCCTASYPVWCGGNSCYQAGYTCPYIATIHTLLHSEIAMPTGFPLAARPE